LTEVYKKKKIVKALYIQMHLITR